MAQITGVEPGLGIEHLAGGLGPIEIALHHLGAAGEHQSALLLQGAAAIGINDFELGSRQRPAGTAARLAQRRRQLSTGLVSVRPTHQQFDADGLEKGIDVLGQGPTAADGGAQCPPASCLRTAGHSKLLARAAGAQLSAATAKPARRSDQGRG